MLIAIGYAENVWAPTAYGSVVYFATHDGSFGEDFGERPMMTIRVVLIPH